MMTSRTEKIVSAACGLFVLIVAVVLIAVGSFLPLWASVKNTTADGNVSYSLWMREECFGIICNTNHVRVQWNHQECWTDHTTNREKCKKTQGYKMRAETTCRVANYCNSTWIGDGGGGHDTFKQHQSASGCGEIDQTINSHLFEDSELNSTVDWKVNLPEGVTSTPIRNGVLPVPEEARDFDNVPSLLYVGKACETPAVVSALISILLFIIKIVLLVKKPHIKRLNLKAAYITFGLIAGVAAVVGMTIFCVMLDKDKYNMGWAPYLNCAGGVVYILFGFGGYLSWRNRAAEEFEDDRSEFEKEFSDVKTTRPFLDRQSSRTAVKSAEAQV